ncbi:MAG: thiopurine S-methyltransferase [Acidobacteriota bacterium]
MEPDFWHHRWQNRQIGFHEGMSNRFLVRHFGALGLPAARRILVPLCGKSRDIAWLLAEGHRVLGVELSETAVRELFAELDLVPEIEDAPAHRIYRGPGLEVFVGDFFDLTDPSAGSIDAVYDRAALVALPASTRRRYARRLAELTGGAPQLVITFEYDASHMEGPPFSIDGDEVRRCHGDTYRVELLGRAEVGGPLRERVAADECAWLLTPV